MRFIVFGAGRMGTVAARDLAARAEVREVALADSNAESLRRAADAIGSEKVRGVAIDLAGDPQAVVEAIRGYDVGLVFLPTRRGSYAVLEAAIRAGLDLVDVLEESHRWPDELEIEGLEIPAGMSVCEYGEDLHRRAGEAGMVLVDGIGLEPGLTNITAGEAMRKLDHTDEVRVRVGGIPSKDASLRHGPLRYVITWSFEHVLREYMVTANVLEGGVRKTVPASTQLEGFDFEAFGRRERLEAAITPGMPTFPYTRPELETFVAKTVRWPGHWEAIQTFKACGLLSAEPVEVRPGVSVVPRELVSAAVGPQLRKGPGDGDVAVIYSTVRGRRDGQKVEIRYAMWDEAGPDAPISAMGRTTAYTAAAAAVAVARGQVAGKGIVAPEDAIVGDAYRAVLADLAARGVVIEESERVID